MLFSSLAATRSALPSGFCVCQFQRRAERRPSQSHGIRNADGFVSATELGRPAQNETYIKKELTSYGASGVHSSGIGLWLRGGTNDHWVMSPQLQCYTHSVSEDRMAAAAMLTAIFSHAADRSGLKAD